MSERWGVMLYEPKFDVNVGGVFRSAHAFGADFIGTIGDGQYVRQPTDTSNAVKHLDFYWHLTFAAFLDQWQGVRPIIRVEVDGDTELADLLHPLDAVYIFGGEATSVPEVTGAISVRIPTRYCLNLATAASIVMYDRVAKLSRLTREAA